MVADVGRWVGERGRGSGGHGGCQGTVRELIDEDEGGGGSAWGGGRGGSVTWWYRPRAPAIRPPGAPAWPSDAARAPSARAPAPLPPRRGPWCCLAGGPYNRPPRPPPVAAVLGLATHPTCIGEAGRPPTSVGTPVVARTPRVDQRDRLARAAREPSPGVCSRPTRTPPRRRKTDGLDALCHGCRHHDHPPRRTRRHRLGGPPTQPPNRFLPSTALTAPSHGRCQWRRRAVPRSPPRPPLHRLWV